jgi:signal transduction histidine kinase
VADASHELRNPLAAIRGYAELTRRDREQLPTEAAYAMSRVESEGRAHVPPGRGHVVACAPGCGALILISSRAI